MSFELMQGFLRCPNCHSSSLMVEKVGTTILCEACDCRYPVSFGRPVFLRSDNELFCQNDYKNAKAPVIGDERSIWKRLVPKSSVNLASQRVLSKVRELLEKKPLATVLVVGGGGQRQWLDEHLGSGDSIRVIYSDIDVRADVDLFCDGHDLPFVDGAFDAVVTTAVLEHVLYPEHVAAEIIRVLKVGGLLYSELPFMQQVHEGAYDFTRYTMSGHMRLFNRVSVIDSGMVAGPGTALVWAIENFMLALIPSLSMRKLIKAGIRFSFGWLKYFDYLFKSNSAALDGASCTFLLGKKINDAVSDSEIIAQYMGAQSLSHK